LFLQQNAADRVDTPQSKAISYYAMRYGNALQHIWQRCGPAVSVYFRIATKATSAKESHFAGERKLTQSQRRDEKIKKRKEKTRKQLRKNCVQSMNEKEEQ